MQEHPLPIWFFIGILLVIYGFLIMGQGMWELFRPPAHPVVLVELHASLWWGALLLILGGIFLGRSSPW
jgi:H+/Cl- antiporter ClcA